MEWGKRKKKREREKVKDKNSKFYDQNFDDHLTIMRQKRWVIQNDHEHEPWANTCINDDYDDGKWKRES